jgi:membrane-bound ClpP family serine protease
MERLALDTVEAALLLNHIGQEFEAIVISGSKPQNGNGNGNGTGKSGNGKNGSGSSGIIQVAEPAVTARCAGELESGTKVRVRLVSSDITTREIHFELVP